MKLTAEQVIDNFNVLKGDRGIWEDHWQDLLDYIVPRKSDINSTNTPGRKKGQGLFDSTAMNSAEFLAGELHGLLTNSNQEWFELTAGQPELDRIAHVKTYLQKLTTSMHRVLNNTNFQTEVHEVYLDLVSIGTAIMTAEDDDDAIVRFRTRTIKEVYLKENSKGVVDEVYRTFEWTARQIVQEFAKGVKEDDAVAITKIVGKKVYKAFKENDAKKFEIIHAVYLENVTEKKAKPFMSQHVLVIDKIELRVNGFRLFPYITPRWTKASGETYGRSPGMNALPEAKTLNAMMKTIIIGAQKTVDPPIQIPDEGFVMPFKTAPASINYYRAGSQDVAKPIYNDTRIDFGFQMVQDKRIQIKEAFFVDKLSLTQSDRMTTVEVNQRVEEQVRLLSPILGRQLPEFLRPVVERTLDSMIRKDVDGDLIGEVPPELAGITLDVQYVSTIAVAQRVSQGQNMLRALQASEPFFTLAPSSADVMDPERAIRENWRIYGAPHSVLRTDEELEQFKKEKQAAQQAAIEQEQAAAQADQLQKVGPLLKE
jgi:hypothetical protein